MVRGVVTRRIAKGPGIHAATEAVRVRLALGERPEASEIAGWRQAVHAMTGYQLEVAVAPEPATAVATPAGE